MQTGLFLPDVVDPKGEEGLASLRQRCLSCTKCVLSKSRTHAVFGEGNSHEPDILFFGEGPGAVEDAKGRPFVGPSGKLLDRMIAAMGYRREELYLANAIACRAPDNRTPEKGELDACYEYVLGQARAVRPKVIVALGGTAYRALFGGKKKISEVRGKWAEWESFPVLPTFHPAFLLRVEMTPEGPDFKKLAWGDLQLVLHRLGRRAAP